MESTSPQSCDGTESSKPFRLAVVGSRKYQDMDTVTKYLDSIRKEYGDFVLICGMEETGADGLGYRYAQANGLTIEEYPAPWDNLEVPGAVVRMNTYGRPYNVRAGFIRNTEMAERCTHVIAFWDGKSPGTKHMLETCKKLGRKMKVYIINSGTNNEQS